MRYQVPQFIDVEDRIFGPLTIKQFVYLAGGAGLSFALWRTLPLLIAFTAIIPIIGLSLGLAFYKVNNRPLITTLEYALGYLVGKKLYLWETQKKVPTPSEIKKTQEHELISVPKLSESKLKDLAWSLDIKENLGHSTETLK